MWATLIQAALSALQNKSKAEQASRDSQVAASQMKYSPWTGLAGQAGLQGQQARSFNAGEDLAQRSADLFTSSQAQRAADAKAQEEREFRNQWLQLQSKKMGTPYQPVQAPEQSGFWGI